MKELIERINTLKENRENGERGLDPAIEFYERIATEIAGLESEIERLRNTCEGRDKE
jgi:hypothetical protein